MLQNIYLYLDESGNFGSAGRYFTIAAIETNNPKPLQNVMKKTVLKAKQKFPKYEKVKEIKASHSSPIVKEYFLRKIVSNTNLCIRYIVADKYHVKEELLDNENLLYNYLLKYLIVPVVKKNKPSRLLITLDKRSIKMKSSNSFEDYINLILRFEMGLDIDISVNYLESQNSYLIQAADFVSNAIYTRYEYNYNFFMNILMPKIVEQQHYPHRCFGKSRNIEMRTLQFQ